MIRMPSKFCSVTLKSKIDGNVIRLRLEIAGTVQGVGFRPCVHRLALELGLVGWVRNSASGVEIEIEGNPEVVRQFPDLLERQLPPHALITRSSRREIPLGNDREFRIEHSVTGDPGESTAEMLTDLATCPECLAEILDPTDRRFGYPFTNCTQCGPRYSILLDLPYDRRNTTMAAFTMCQRCREEYESAQDRRFHAQPNACGDCGPRLIWRDAFGTRRAEREEALEQSALAIERGEIVAVKGIGGFHLFADALSVEAIEVLRQRKHRPGKPFALMMPSLDSAREQVDLSEVEAEWLTSSAAPIVILQRKATCPLPESLAPGNPGLGIMLPYSPLHHLLMRRLGFPVVATSGNLGDEPICTENDDAVERLNGIADGFLVHDRPIARAVDDSVIREVAGSRMVLRRSRGFAPTSISVPDIATPVLAYGGDLKGTIAVAAKGQVRLSQHFGDLASLESRLAFEYHIEDFPSLCRIAIKGAACDCHRAYHSQRLALDRHQHVVTVQHHHAHAVACAVENGIGAEESFLGVTWDGTGYGDDGTIWGGEFLLCRGSEFQRFAWLRPFPLPGGDKAVNDPRFAALGCLYEAGIPLEDTPLLENLSTEERRVAQRMLEQKINTPLCSSAGRLFDAVSALSGLCHKNEFEGQAAQALEFVASSDSTLTPYPFDDSERSGGGEICWVPILQAVVDDLNKASVDLALISRRFHLTLVDIVVKVAKEAGCATVALTGGCFQNALLLEQSIVQLRRAELRPIWHKKVPANDGGLALGQAVVASRRLSLQTE